MSEEGQHSGRATPSLARSGGEGRFAAWCRLLPGKLFASGAGRSPGKRGHRLLLRRIRWERVAAIALLLVAGAERTLDPAPARLLRLLLFDFYQSTEPRPVPEVGNQPVVIVDIDDKSLAAIGQWPWPRTLTARMVQNLTRLRAAAIGLDIIFSQPDRMSPARFAKTARGLDKVTLEKLRKQPSNDAVFARVLQRSRVVLSQTARPRAIEGESGPPPRKTSVARIGGDPRPYLAVRYGSLIRNLPELEQAATGIGMILPGLEPDGVIRRIPALAQVGKELYPALAIELLRVASRKKAYAVRSDRKRNGITGLVVAGIRIPTDAMGNIWVRYTRHHASRYVSAKDLLAGTVPPQRIAGRLVLIGSSSGIFQDIQLTPLGYMPGVEVHAQLLETILANAYLTRPTNAVGIELAMTLITGLLIIVLLPWLGARWTLLLLLVAVAGAGATSWYLYTEKGMLIDFSYAAIVTFLIYILLSYVGFARTETQRKKVRSAFGHYISPALVEQLAADPDRLRLGGEAKEMTFLFCDVRQFTALSEKFKSDPEGLTRLINRFLTPMTDAILRCGGTVDKYMGDCIMAFWNAPLDDEAHAEHACEAALMMFTELDALNARLEEEAAQQNLPFHRLRMGVGLNTGRCIVGNMGSDQRFDYSVLGDAVNLASRLEGQSKTYGVDIILGEGTASMINGFAILEIDLLMVVGKTEPIRIYTVVGDEIVAVTEEFLAHRAGHDEMLAAYREQRWDDALAALEGCRRSGPEMGLSGLCDVYAERITIFKDIPPGDDWDGVFVAMKK